MLETPLIVTGRMNLVALLLPLLEGKPIIVVGSAEEAATKLDAARASEPYPYLILDAYLATSSVAQPDYSGSSAVEFLKRRRKIGDRTPALVITLETNPDAIVDNYCTPDNGAIALPTVYLDRSEIFSAFVKMLADPPQLTWNTIEIEIIDNKVKCVLRGRGNAGIEWREITILPKKTLLEMAGTFEEYRPLPGQWLSQLRHHGNTLFNTLVIRVLGPGLFSHIETTAGGLSGLAFRFRVDDPRYYPVPFEASVREVDSDLDGGPFVLLSAPLARRITVPKTPLGKNGSSQFPHPTRVLFVSSPLVNKAKYKLNNRDLTFEVLPHLATELEDLQKLAAQVGNTKLIIEPLDLGKEASTSAAKTLAEKLDGGKYEIVHFAGHSFTEPSAWDGKTYLVLPGSYPGEADIMSAEEFAGHVGNAGARLVYLSSCRSSSARCAASLITKGVPHVLGFRFDVQDNRAPIFAQAFYEDLFKNSHTIGAAFKTACYRTRNSVEADPSPIWASPILIAQTEDWAL